MPEREGSIFLNKVLGLLHAITKTDNSIRKGNGLGRVIKCINENLVDFWKIKINYPCLLKMRRFNSIVQYTALLKEDQFAALNQPADCHIFPEGYARLTANRM
jgi:hypothetical protein